MQAGDRDGIYLGLAMLTATYRARDSFARQCRYKKTTNKEQRLRRSILLLVTGLLALHYPFLIFATGASESLSGLTPTQLQAYEKLSEAVKKGDLETAKEILGKTPRLVGVDGARDYSLVLNTIWYPNKQMMKLLLDRHARINSTPPNKEPLLWEAMERNKSYPHSDELAMLLIESGADVTMGYEKMEGANALMVAVNNCLPVVVDTLVKKGIDVNAKTTTGNTAVHAIFDTCMQYSRQRDEMRARMLKSLVKNGADVNAVNNDGLSALDLAKFLAIKSNEERGGKELVRMLEDLGAKSK